MSAAAKNRIYFRPVECQELFGIHLSTLYRWAKNERIKIHKAGRMSLVKVADMERLIEGQADAD